LDLGKSPDHERGPAAGGLGGRQRLLAAPHPAHRPRIGHRSKLMTTSPSTAPASEEPAVSASSTPALRLEGVRKTYTMGDEEIVALDHADLEVGADEIVALVGPSG